MAKKQDSFYFDNFVACAEDSCRAAQMLKAALENFRPDTQRAGTLPDYPGGD